MEEEKKHRIASQAFAACLFAHSSSHGVEVMPGACLPALRLPLFLCVLPQWFKDPKAEGGKKGGVTSHLEQGAL